MSTIDERAAYPIETRDCGGPAVRTHNIDVGSSELGIDAWLYITEFQSFNNASAHIEDGRDITVMALETDGYALLFGEHFTLYLRRDQLADLASVIYNELQI